MQLLQKHFWQIISDFLWQSSFVSSKMATALLSSGAIPYCLQVLKSLLPFWHQFAGPEVNPDVLVDRQNIHNLIFYDILKKNELICTS